MGADIPPEETVLQQAPSAARADASSPSASSTSSINSMSPTAPTPRKNQTRAAASSSWCSEWLSLLKECCAEDHRSLETELQPPMPRGSGTRIDAWGPFFFADEELEDVVQEIDSRRVELGSVSPGRIGRYRVFNSAVQNQRSSGVTFRYTKSDTDKVRREHPVPWGTVVQGVDEGDGWLRVGRYFLPMTWKGQPLLIPLDGQAIPAAARARMPAKGSARARGADVVSCSLPVDRRPPTPATAKQPVAIHPRAADERPWQLLPSVGTWVHQVHKPSRSVIAEVAGELVESAKVQLDTSAEESELDAAAEEAVPFPEEDLGSPCAQEEDDNTFQEEEPKLFADILGKPTKPSELDSNDGSPSTCSPTSTLPTPMSMVPDTPVAAN